MNGEMKNARFQNIGKFKEYNESIDGVRGETLDMDKVVN